ncbi:MAG: hypothetical protein Q4A69_09150, partial [Moraxella sp.]|nr:hypothetical protein [Moraxella sp.]
EIENSEIENDNHSINKIRQRIYEQIVAPSCELVGAWTPEKWDYWVSLARQNRWLDVDELALANRSMMTGEIGGACRLYVPDNNKQIMVSFDGFATKFATLCPDSQLDKTIFMLGDDKKVQALQTPAIKRDLRYRAVIIQAQEQLLNSPVLQTLWQSGYIDDKADGAIFETKLLLSAPTNLTTKG